MRTHTEQLSPSQGWRIAQGKSSTRRARARRQVREMLERMEREQDAVRVLHDGNYDGFWN
jgi:hypothetical protein